MSWSGYIPGSLLRERDFLRPGTIPLYGSGTAAEAGSKVGVSAYPNQGLDLATQPYAWFWLSQARTYARSTQILGAPISGNGRSGECKRRGLAQFTPLGTPVAELTRTGGDMLASPCGYCGVNIGKCACGKGNGVEGE